MEMGNRAPWDLMMTFTAPEGGHYGVGYDGNNFYTSNWGYSSAAHNFYKYDLQGNMIEGYEIAGCGTLRGIAYDGQYFYGVANSSTVYCVDLANHAVINTFTSAYGAMRCITYDPVRDGFWVVGNWSGNLTLIDRTGAIVQVGPEPASASDVAYFKDENDVEHVLVFTQPSSDCQVFDYNITTGTYTSAFNFSSNTPGCTGSSGGCFVGEFNNKVVFIGDSQQSPNLIAVYELCEASAPAPQPGESSCLGAMIFADGEWEAFVEYPTNEYTYEGDASVVCVRMVYDGTANLPEGNIYFSMSCPECEPWNGGDYCEPGDPIHGEYVWNDYDDFGALIWWGEQVPPIVPVEEWLYYDDGTYATSIGVGGGTIWWASMFPANVLTPYAGTSLTKVALYENSYNTDQVTVSIYLGGANAPQTLVSTQNFNPVGADDFHEVTLNTPVAIDGTQNVWIVFSEYGTYPANACADTGDANNRWCSLDGSEWMDVATAGVPGYGWMIRGFVTNQAKGVHNIAIENSKPEVVETSGLTLGHTAVVSKPAPMAFMNNTRSELIAYNVYRANEAAGPYELIAVVPAVAGQTYYEWFDDEMPAGIYYYQVTAVYDNGCESEPAPAFDNPTVDYVDVYVTAIGENTANVAIYPNPTNGNVKIEAEGMNHITVVSVLGQMVYDADVNADELELNMAQFNTGVYVVRIVTENGISTQRVTVVR